MDLVCLIIPASMAWQGYKWWTQPLLAGGVMLLMWIQGYDWHAELAGVPSMTGLSSAWETTAGSPIRGLAILSLIYLGAFILGGLLVQLPLKGRAGGS